MLLQPTILCELRSVLQMVARDALKTPVRLIGSYRRSLGDSSGDSNGIENEESATTGNDCERLQISPLPLLPSMKKVNELTKLRTKRDQEEELRQSVNQDCFGFGRRKRSGTFCARRAPKE